MLRSGREQAESLQRQHPKYRAFQDEMVASLTTFEQVEEWPDLIKCLGRVQKTLAKFSMVESLPSLVMLSKRLAQCLNPGLPSGVHMKALDTYAIVFVRLGKEKLTQNLGLFSAGLFPLLAYSSTRIRPQLLSLFEEFYVPLGTQLIPSLSGFILALLPGIEDPTSETYNRVLNLLESLKNCTGKPLFMLSLWRCLLLCPQSRLSGVQYISFIANQNQLSSLLPVKKSIAIEAIIATLYDGNVLAQRGMFEVLISHFPLSGIMTPKYTIEVLHGALPVLLRRESSVNRRFFSWLLTHPTEMTSDSTLVQVDPSNSESDSSTLLESTLDLVLNALLRMMDDVCQLVKSITQSSVLNYGDDNSPFDLKIIEKAVQPFDLVALLMERPEIKNSFFFERIVHALVSFAYQLYFLNISESISMIPNSPPIISAPTQESGSNIHLGLSQTIIQCAQSFLASQRIDRVWTSLIQILLEQFEGNTDYSMAKIVFPASSDSIIEALVLVDFSIDFLGIFSSNSETDKIGLSNIINIVLKGLFSLQWPPDRVSAFKCSLQFVLKMLQKLPDGANALDPQVRYDILRKFYFPSPALISLGDFYFSAKNEEHSFPAESGLKGNRIPLSILETLSHLFHLYETLLFSEIKSVSDKSSNHWVNSVELARVFSEISLQFSDAKDIDVSCIGLHSFLICVEKFEFLNLEPTCSRICRILWTFLDQKYSDSHYHICQLLYKLESLVPDACTDVISDALLSRHEKDRIEGFRRFSILWSTLGEITSFEDESLFSHGLMLMLDGLDDNRQSIRLVAQTWLLDSLSNSSNRVLDPLILHLLDSSTYKEPPRFEYLGMYDVRLVLYVLQKLISIITRDSKVFMESVIGKAVEGVVKAKWEKAERFLSYPRENVYDIDKIRLPEPEDYLSLLSFIAIRFIQGTPKANFPSEFV